MTSLEIAELVNKRHDNVKRTIEKLIELGEIIQPQIEDEQFTDVMGRDRAIQTHIFTGDKGKRDSIVVVAQLSPKFTAALVDRWMELESIHAKTSAARIDGKEVRKLETSAIKDLVEYAEAQGSKSAKMYYTNITRMTNALLGIEAGQRDSLTHRQLQSVRMAESMIEITINDCLREGIAYKDIYTACKDKVSVIAQMLTLK